MRTSRNRDTPTRTPKPANVLLIWHDSLSDYDTDLSNEIPAGPTNRPGRSIVRMRSAVLFCIRAAGGSQTWPEATVAAEGTSPRST